MTTSYRTKECQILTKSAHFNYAIQNLQFDAKIMDLFLIDLTLVVLDLIGQVVSSLEVR